MIFIERYPLKRCVKLCCNALLIIYCMERAQYKCIIIIINIIIASKVNCFLNITDLSEVQLCMSSNSWTWECPHTKDSADYVPKKNWVVYYVLKEKGLKLLIKINNSLQNMGEKIKLIDFLKKLQLSKKYQTFWTKLRI